MSKTITGCWPWIIYQIPVLRRLDHPWASDYHQGMPCIGWLSHVSSVPEPVPLLREMGWIILINLTHKDQSLKLEMLQIPLKPTGCQAMCWRRIEVGGITPSPLHRVFPKYTYYWLLAYSSCLDLPLTACSKVVWVKVKKASSIKCYLCYLLNTGSTKMLLLKV